MSKRNDVHRPSEIIASDYRYLCAYSGATSQGGWPVPPWNIDVMLRFVNEARERGNKQFGRNGKCGVCGAHYIYGELWQHEPTGDVVHLGHECADKYNLLADRTGAKRERSAWVLREMKREQREEFLNAHEGLAEAFEVEHHIIADIKARFEQYGSISEKQVALVLKLAHEVKNPRPEEPHVPAPEGRVDFTGEVVSVKVTEDSFGTQVKCTIKVYTDAGTWLAWGTVPTALVCQLERGDQVSVRATLKPGKDAHFCFMKRPIMALANYLPDHSSITGKKRVSIVDAVRANEFNTLDNEQWHTYRANYPEKPY